MIAQMKSVICRNLKLDLQVYVACYILAVLYGEESWFLALVIIKKIEAFEILIHCHIQFLKKSEGDLVHKEIMNHECRKLGVL